MVGDIHFFNVYLLFLYNQVSVRTMRVSKWGNSLGIRLPAAVVSGLQLEEGDDIEVIIADDRSFAVHRKPGRKTLLKRLRRFRGKVPADFLFDRNQANAR